MSSSKKKKTGVTSTIASVDEVPPTAVVVKGVIEELPISPTRKKKPGLTATKPESVENKNSILKPPNERKAKEFLAKHNWPSGLQDALVKSCKKIAVRYVITDDSGSMMTNDGHRMVGGGTKNVKMIQCTRWSELTASLKFHAELAQAAQAPTEFRLLNNCEPIMVGLADDKDGAALQAALTVSTRGFCPPRLQRLKFPRLPSITFISIFMRVTIDIRRRVSGWPDAPVLPHR
jgi:hypothetical protein